MAFLDLLQQAPWFLYTVTGLFGLAVGSFLNVAIYRLPVMMEKAWASDCREFLKLEPAADPDPGQEKPFNLSVPRSRCPQCGHVISALENVPVISYLILRGRCSACGTRISPRYPLVELLTAVLSIVVIWRFGASLQGLAALVLTWVLIALSFIDIDKQLLPDNITLPWLWVGLLLSLFGLFSNPTDSIIGALAGYLSLWLVYQAFKLVTGKEGMGYGDFKLLALFGAWMGWQALPLIILLSSAVGALIGGSLMLIRGHDRNVPIPFGPYLAIAGWIALLWGDTLIAAWLQWMQPV
jgi:leader peptidase (prepilin peptidase)/N-methyltransferase